MSRRSYLHGAVRHPREPKLLLLRSDREWRLPRVLVRDAVWEANAAVIVPALERRLGAPLWLLRCLQSSEDEAAGRIEAVLELELLESDWAPPAHGRWVGSGELPRVGLKDERHRPLLASWFIAAEREEAPAERAPWARPGWRDDARAWIEREVARLGHDVVAVEQVKHWSISTILRITTTGPELYFKVPARLPLFVEEATVTARLAERFPRHVPAPLVVEPELGWMLLPRFDELFGWDSPHSARAEMLQRFARLQREASGIVSELLADGCLDRRLEVLASQIDPLLADPAATARLTTDEKAELRRLAPRLKQVCRRLAEVGPPPTLVHGDLHLGNVARLSGELVYFDWTDACVAHPFIDLHSLQWEKDEESRRALLEAYLTAWEGVSAPDRLREAAALAAVVIPIHHAVSYRHIVASLEPDAKPELDATHVFLREILAQARNWPVG